MQFGDVVEVDFGTPIGSEAGFVRPAVVSTADGFLRYRPTSMYVVPLTTTKRAFPSHVPLTPDPENTLRRESWAQVELLRAVSTARCRPLGGNVGRVAASQIAETIAMIVGL